MERSTIVRVHDGLHARPATRFVKLASSFGCDLQIAKGAKTISARSAVKLMLLSVKEGDSVTLTAEGAEAEAALDALVAFLSDPAAGLQDGDAPEPAAAPIAPPPAPAKSTVSACGALRGIGASEGHALARAFPFFPRQFQPTGRALPPADIAAEADRFRAAQAIVQLAMAEAVAAAGSDDTERAILGALNDIASDAAIMEEILARIGTGTPALDAILAVIEDAAAEFAAAEDAYITARADDIRAVGRQLCFALAGEREADLGEITEPVVIVADDIGVWELSRAPVRLVRGLVCGHGAATSHIAIIARAHGIPAVLGLGSLPERLRAAKTIALNGSTGEVHADPAEDVAEAYGGHIAAAAEETARLAAYRSLRPRRADGTEIEVAANIGSEEEAEPALAAGAMGVGLFRTELLFMKQGGLPSEDAQTVIYRRVAERFAPDAVIVRTLDIGGDKPVAGIAFPKEENPFLGWRGIRMCLDRPDVFRPQLRALLRANVVGNIKVMLPMVSRLDEVRRTRAMIADCIAELTAEGIDHRDVPLGVMIETPAAVLIAEDLAREVAFFSIGTNDLTQYVMAADRLNPRIADLYDVTDPAVLAAIRATARAGCAAGIPVGMCGEAAARPDLIGLFIEMGLTELSMSPASIPRAKAVIAGPRG